MSEAIPRSHRPGFFNARGHITVCQTGFFFSIIWTGTSMTIPRSHKSGLWYGHWRPRSKKGFKKTRGKTQSERRRYGHCRTGSKPWTPSSVVHKTSPYWWTADARVRIVAFPIAVNTMARNGRGEFIYFFFLDVGVCLTSTSRKKILNLPPSVSHHRICGDWKGNNSNPGIRRPSIRESFMDNGGRRSRFWPGPAVTIPQSLESRFYLFFFSKSFLIETSMAIPWSHRPGFFLIPFLI